VTVGCAVGVIARAPSRGGKTRLAPYIPERQLQELRGALLSDTLAVVEAAPDVARIVFFTPSDAAGEFATAVARGWAVRPQAAGDLGARMRTAFEHLLVERGYAAALLVGADLPFLTVDDIVAARTLVERHDGVVIGPAEDGGYYLIGMARVHAPLFDGVAWGSASVLDSTVRCAERLGVDVRLVATGFDIDTIDDLRRAERRLASSPASVAPSLRGWLSRYGF
jgi:uncharacterized protein